MKDTEREKEAETQAEGEAGSMQGARRGTRSRDPRIAPWAKGRRQTAEPPRDPKGTFTETRIEGALQRPEGGASDRTVGARVMGWEAA